MARAADLDLGDIDLYRGKQAEVLTPAENSHAISTGPAFGTWTGEPKTCRE